jgi:hypothetical protein
MIMLIFSLVLPSVMLRRACSDQFAYLSQASLNTFFIRVPHD